MKKGAVSIFVILGIVIIVIIALLLLIKTTKYEIPFLEKDAAGEMAQIKEEIAECLSSQGTDYVKRIGAQGGYLNTPEGSFIRYNDSAVSYLCYNQIELPTCTNRLLTKAHMEAELAEAIQDSLSTCINVFEISDDVSAQGEMKATVSIAQNSVDIILSYPIAIDKGEGDRIAEDKFSVSLNYPLGELYDVAMDIVDAEASVGEFDQLIYMLDHTGRYEIIKDRPYPDKVYQLRLMNNNFMFQFAVQGGVS
ncbi:hypothetical protein HZB88_03965 [archaeon]|nr:hypothetical protein [archaeon]